MSGTNDDLFNEVLDILDKLSAKYYETAVEEFKRLYIGDADNFSKVLDLVFEKGQGEQNYSAACAELCKVLDEMHVPDCGKPKNRGGQRNVDFRALLMLRCQKNFQQDLEREIDIEKEWKKIRCIKTPGHRRRLELKAKEDLETYRLDAVHNVRFMGELYKRNLISEFIMMKCIYYLLQINTQLSLKLLCTLLLSIGQSLGQWRNNGTYQSANNDSEGLDACFTKLQKLVDKKDKILSRTMKSMISELFQLRNNQWKSKTCTNQQPNLASEDLSRKRDLIQDVSKSYQQTLKNQGNIHVKNAPNSSQTIQNVPKPSTKPLVDYDNDLLRKRDLIKDVSKSYRQTLKNQGNIHVKNAPNSSQTIQNIPKPSTKPLVDNVPTRTLEKASSRVDNKIVLHPLSNSTKINPVQTVQSIPKPLIKPFEVYVPAHTIENTLSPTVDNTMVLQPFTNATETSPVQPVRNIPSPSVETFENNVPTKHKKTISPSIDNTILQDLNNPTETNAFTDIATHTTVENTATSDNTIVVQQLRTKIKPTLRKRIKKHLSPQSNHWNLKLQHIMLNKNKSPTVDNVLLPLRTKLKPTLRKHIKKYLSPQSNNWKLKLQYIWLEKITSPTIDNINVLELLDIATKTNTEQTTQNLTKPLEADVPTLTVEKTKIPTFDNTFFLHPLDNATNPPQKARNVALIKPFEVNISPHTLKETESPTIDNTFFVQPFDNTPQTVQDGHKPSGNPTQYDSEHLSEISCDESTEDSNYTPCVIQ